MINRLLITALLLCLLPVAAAFGQELRQEKLKGILELGSSGQFYAVFYSDGMPESAIWPLGMKLRAKDEDGGSTIRHTESKGNSDGTIENIAVNDKVPYRFIIAPADGSDNLTWTEAMGLKQNSASGNLNPGGEPMNPAKGCAAYETPEFPKGSWRLPTQREMMLMWLFRTGINATYTNGQLTQSDYWTATEANGLDAWFMSVSDTNPQMVTGLKNASKKYRCVRDY